MKTYPIGLLAGIFFLLISLLFIPEKHTHVKVPTRYVGIRTYYTTFCLTEKSRVRSNGIDHYQGDGSFFTCDPKWEKVYQDLNRRGSKICK